MVIVEIITEENRRKILENKKKLRRKDVWLEEDQTFKERKMKWRLMEITGKEQGKGKNRENGKNRIWKNMHRKYIVIFGMKKNRC